MKTGVEVKDRDEAYWLRRGLRNDAVRGFVVLIGRLSVVDAPYIPQVMADATQELRAKLNRHAASATSQVSAE